MSETSGIKIFISWSGSPAREIALVLKDWLEEVYDDVLAWVSDRDIEAGARSMQEIEESLRDARAGIIVVTEANMMAPWLNFEAGALSKQLYNERNRVIPLLVDLKRPTDLRGPLSILQAVMMDQDGITRVLQSLNTMMGLDPERAHRRVATYWEQLSDTLGPLCRSEPEEQSSDERKSDRPLPPSRESTMLPEMLEILRALRDRELLDGAVSVWPREGAQNIPKATKDQIKQRLSAAGVRLGVGFTRAIDGWVVVTDTDVPREVQDDICTQYPDLKLTFAVQPMHRSST